MSNVFLEGRTALVTGGTSGIGLAIAEALASAGGKVIINGLGDADQIRDALASIDAAGNAESRFESADLRDPAAIDAMMQRCLQDGGIDILINCAGMQIAKPLEQLPDGAWESIIAVNLSAAYHCMRRALPTMAAKGFGRVVNIASVHGLVASAGKAPYVASKFGLVGLSKAIALEYAAVGSRETGGVTVNCICPGWVETPLIEPQIEARRNGGRREDGVRDLLREKQPSLRMSHPDEIADTVIWLCRRQSHNITGTSIAIDGAWTAQ